MISKVAKTDARVLITGENGTGKELVANQLHEQSNRTNKNFIEVNCAAIPSELIESELFGHVKGSFTSAIKDRSGKFEAANKGTLFLDEIADMSLAAQAKVLRALEENRIQRVGNEKDISIDVRVIAATNKDLKKEIAEGRFREDLYHRLAVIIIHVPKLIERKEDIPLLTNHFIELISKEQGLEMKNFTKEAMKKLDNYSWTGNIRELRNIIERHIILGDKYEDDVDTPRDSELSNQNVISLPLKNARKVFEKNYLQSQLNRFDGNISKTASFIGMERSALHRKLKQLGLTEDLNK